MSYRWQPLNKERQEIRLLDLKAGAETSFLSGKLRHVFLSDPVKPRYETVSYAWGESALVKSIVVDEKSISIPASAAAALRCIRLPQCDRTIWIDCICINQDNDNEKSHQVGLMARSSPTLFGHWLSLATTMITPRHTLSRALHIFLIA